MIPKETLKNVRRIQIHTSHIVNDVLGGVYQSVFKGKGMEFEEVREYQPGDDIRSIDWNVTARTGNPNVKKFVEERELTVMLILDGSSSSYFGSVKQFKSELGAELCALFAFSAIRNNDKVGLIIFTDRVEKYLPPKKGSRNVLRVIREALYFKPEGRGTDIPTVLEYLNKVTIRRTVTFLISDFLADDYEKPLRIAKGRHDIIAINIMDPREYTMPGIGIVDLEDAESGERILLDTSSAEVRRKFNELAQRKLQERRRIFRSLGLDSIEVRTDQPYLKPLLRFFRRRERRLR